MTDQFFAHETVAWAKQRLNELDAIITEVEKSAENLKESARKEADRASARLWESRARLQKYYDSLQAETDVVKRDVVAVQRALEAEWVEAESALQSFLSEAKDEAETVRGIVAARVRAQRQSWEESLKNLRDQATEAVETARGEFDATLKRLSEEAEAFQNRIGEAKDAGDESWKALKSGLIEAKNVHDRTIRKITEAFSKLF